MDKKKIEMALKVLRSFELTEDEFNELKHQYEGNEAYFVSVLTLEDITESVSSRGCASSASTVCGAVKEMLMASQDMTKEKANGILIFGDSWNVKLRTSEGAAIYTKLLNDQFEKRCAQTRIALPFGFQPFYSYTAQA